MTVDNGDVHCRSSGSLRSYPAKYEAQKQRTDDKAGYKRMCLLPAEIYHHIAAGGAAKPENSLLREASLGVLAGAFIGFGFATCMLAAGQLSPEYRKAEPGMFNLLFGAYGFPVGLSMCVINGASLFTSNIAYMLCAVMEKKASILQLLWITCFSWFANLAGSLVLVQVMISGDVFLHREAFTIELALKKTSYSFGATMCKGILCNWLVCMAVWQGNAAQDVTGKLLGIWFPISAFVTMGFEHCIANQFILPLALRLGAPLTVRDILVKNLLPATVGNIIGGGLFVATFYGLAYGSLEKTITAAYDKLLARGRQLFTTKADAPLVRSISPVIQYPGNSLRRNARNAQVNSSINREDINGAGNSVAQHVVIDFGSFMTASSSSGLPMQTAAACNDQNDHDDGHAVDDAHVAADKPFAAYNSIDVDSKGDGCQSACTWSAAPLLINNAVMSDATEADARGKLSAGSASSSALPRYSSIADIGAVRREAAVAPGTVATICRSFDSGNFWASASSS